MMGYDAENRITSENPCPDCTSLYYDPAGKRVAIVNANQGTWTLYFYDIFGQRILTLPSTLLATSSLYFGSKLVLSDGVAVITDRLGSVRANSNNETFSYFPYGEERTPTANWRVKFGTYFRDYGNWDYADQRYYNPASGRFNTADPSGAKAANSANPSSWNLYAYVDGDPVNHTDRRGLWEDSDGNIEAPSGDDVWTGGAEGGGLAFCVAQPIGETGTYWDCANSSPTSSDPSTYQGVEAPGPAGVQSYQLALNRAKLAQSQITKLNDKVPCDTMLSKLGMSWSDMQAAVAFEDFHDGTTSTMKMTDLFLNSTPSNRANAQIQYGNQTIAAYLASSTAAAVSCAGCKNCL